ncbi:TatD family hydrolase [Pandoraea apista]|uniref:DNAase n=1 Tax=Pandoraea apista TaxID=93218 RepID=A0A0G4JIS1_9BURK|nr:TatD family hydrolase [Pandoraea apista]ALS63821.1 DNAase [Pandoraea apista]OXS89776.1 DNAase [Pandoraea apista]RRW98543.1 TatD family deoxyribonuclease [Pandoraea apista]RRX05170.1 TatD family deoxyribonuclease [Pandoraea apista]CFB63375.1 putative deoxyribonuclease YjjV [Pandoraea apista]
MWIDTHCHLDAAEFDADRATVIADTAAAGVAGLVVPAVECATFDSTRAAAGAIPGGAYALGIHPLYTPRARDEDLVTLRRAVERAMSDPRFVGIGEIGLDFFVRTLDPERQQCFYIEQLKIARDFDLPVILHVRRSQDALLKQLRIFTPRGGIAHAFNGSRQQAEMFVERGFCLGFGGQMTFDRALQIRRLAVDMPLDALVLETDAPDIAPEWRYKQRNSPVELPRIAHVLAELRGVSLDTLSQATCANAWRVLPRLSGAMAMTPGDGLASSTSLISNEPAR